MQNAKVKKDHKEVKSPKKLKEGVRREERFPTRLTVGSGSVSFQIPNRKGGGSG